MQPDTDALRNEIENFTINTEDELEQFRLTFLSRNGKISAMFSKMGEIPKENRAEAGKTMNAVKNLAETKYEEAEKKLAHEDSELQNAADDITLTTPSAPVGSYHPLTIVLNDMKEIFLRMGFSVEHGPELEDDFHNFTALNFPPNHPARDIQDTFFIRKSDTPDEEDLVLRTHTSPVQIRLMENDTPPFRAIIPGRVYRNEAITYKSNNLFNQVEGLYVDKNVSVGDLKLTLVTFARLLYGSDVKYRIRPGFFPFTEPSLEMDIWSRERGEWLEILGCGMVDPNVFEAVGYDPETYTGFAFGMGVDRIAMLRYGITDIRTLYQNDTRFLEQFS